MGLGLIVTGAPRRHVGDYREKRHRKRESFPAELFEGRDPVRPRVI